MLKRFRNATSGFTLIELLVVIAILGILATIAGPRLIGQQDKAKVGATRVQIKELETALDLYMNDNGTYPASEQGLEALRRKPTSPPEPINWQGPYLAKPVPKDPWGNDYVYVYPGTHEGFDYDLTSYGKDGKEGGESWNADITNWSEEEK
jgi:general secretion pathway protein G